MVSLIKFIRKIVSNVIYFYAFLMATVIYFIYPIIAAYAKYFFWFVVIILVVARVVGGDNKVNKHWGKYIMSIEDRIETEKKYKKEDGEPSAIKRPVWNGELMVYMRKVLNEISNERDHKKRFKSLIELGKISYIIEEEFEKASFYQLEFDQMCDLLSRSNLLHSVKNGEYLLDDFGKKHWHTYSEQRSLVKSIPTLRATIQNSGQ